MLNLIRSLVETISLLFNFFLNTIKGLINFIGMIPTYVTFITSLVSVVPLYAQVFFISGITLTIVLFVIGKDQA